MKRRTLLLAGFGLTALACGTAEPSASERDAGVTLDAPSTDAGARDAGTRDVGESDAGAPDAAAHDGGARDAGPNDAGAPVRIRGRFESARPMRACNDIVPWNAPDGVLLRPTFDTCGGDIAALARAIVANLDDAEARGGRVLLIIAQGLFLPAAWTQDCATFELTSGRFTGTSCVPWDARYQARLRAALVDEIGPAVRDHPALVGVYFTISSMTNGSEMHFRAPRSALPSYPGDEVLRAAYLEAMDAYQAAFDVPILFEGGHCIFDSDPDCETPLALYRHARDTYGLDHVGVALWNCAERFFTSERSPDFESRPLIEEVVADGASLGCQTVGNFTSGACQFTDAEIADYGTPPTGPGAGCADSPTYDSEAACVDTMQWFVGRGGRNAASVMSGGTWSEVWSQDYAPTGVYATSNACRDAIDLLAP